MFENVGASTSRNPKDLHGLQRDNFTFYASYVPLESRLILSDGFPDPVDNKGVILGDNVKRFTLYMCA
jgi:hypothetical protein